MTNGLIQIATHTPRTSTNVDNLQQLLPVTFENYFKTEWKRTDAAADHLLCHMCMSSTPLIEPILHLDDRFQKRKWRLHKRLFSVQKDE